MKTPKPTRLFNIVQYYQAPGFTILGGRYSVIKVATQYGKPYALAKSIKRQEELKNYPKGTYFKIVPH